MSRHRSNVARLGLPDPVFFRYPGSDATASSVKYIVCLNVRVTERYAWRWSPASGDVATRIADKDGIWRPKPSNIGMAATHDEIKNISEKLAFRKYIKDLDFETIKMLEQEHKEREYIKEIETQLSMTRIDEQKMKI